MNGAAHLAVVDTMNTASPALYHVHADHLGRPIMMTDSAKAAVWEAQYRPFGEVSAVSGTATLNLRFPGQWYQLEAGLAYNWNRHYDATLGRYLQPDPLGFVDGPSVYAYAKSSPQMLTDPDGRVVPLLVGAAVGIALDATISAIKEYCGCQDQSSTMGAVGSAATGAAIGFVGPFESVAGKGNLLGGGSPSGDTTSTYAKMVHKNYTNKNISGGTSRMLRNLGTNAFPALRLAATGVAAYDLYSAANCR